MESSNCFILIFWAFSPGRIYFFLKNINLFGIVFIWDGFQAICIGKQQWWAALIQNLVAQFQNASQII